MHFECPAMESDALSEEERLARLRRIITRTVDASPPPMPSNPGPSTSGGSAGGGLVMIAERLAEVAEWHAVNIYTI